MHKLKVLAFGSKNFNISLEELKYHLSFKLTTDNNEFIEEKFKNFEVLFIHEHYFKNDLVKKRENLKKTDKIKVLVSHTKDTQFDFFSEKLLLPIGLDDLNKSIENAVAKKNFNKNSTIKIQNYVLDKNEKKLKNNDNHILLTEKEVQLLELFLRNKKPISKNMILKHVWKYAAEADTHTVETHIYRLRKKIRSNFADENFIKNYKNGYVI